MSVNALQIEDVYQLLNQIHNQATGKDALVPTDASSFISQATTTMAVGTETVYSTLMQMVGKTIFSSRRYDPKFDGLRADSVRWGGVIRKISVADSDVSAEKVYHPIDQSSVDQWEIKKGNVLETRFYGSDAYQDFFTTFEEQLKTAFTSANELGSFVALKTNEMNNKWEQYRENMNRLLLSNMIGAKVANATTYPDHVIHLLSEYKTLTGLSTLTAQDIYKPENITGFFRYVRGRINTLSRRMTERSGLYQFQINNLDINRHTPYDAQKIYLTADALDIIDTMVNTQTYHDEPLRYADVQAVSYWQAIKNPNQINIKPNYIDNTGAVVVGTDTQVNNIFGVIFDQDALLYNVKDYSLLSTDLNKRGRYFNTYLSANIQYMTDLSEKAIIMLLD